MEHITSRLDDLAFLAREPTHLSLAGEYHELVPQDIYLPNTIERTLHLQNPEPMGDLIKNMNFATTQNDDHGRARFWNSSILDIQQIIVEITSEQSLNLFCSLRKIE